MTKLQGRVAVARSVSFHPSEWAWIKRRVKQLHPAIRGVSHYFQMLVDLDEGRQLLGPVSGSNSAEKSLVEQAGKRIVEDRKRRARK